MKTKFSAALVMLGIVFLMPLGCGQRKGSAVESYQTSAIEETELHGNSTLQFADHPECNPFEQIDGEQSEIVGIATISNSEAVADSCIAHAKTAANPFAKTADVVEATEPPSFDKNADQTKTITLSAPPKINAEPVPKYNPFAVFDGKSNNQNDIGYSNRENDAKSNGTQPAPGVHRENSNETYRKRIPASTISSPALNSYRNRWNNRTHTETESIKYPEIYRNGVNQSMIMDSYRIPRRIEKLPNPDRKRRRVFSPVPLKKSLEDRLLIQKMKQHHSRLYAQLKNSNFSDSQIRTVAIQMMADEKGNRVENADHHVEATKKKMRHSN